jgi:hypothetical protein
VCLSKFLLVSRVARARLAAYLLSPTLYLKNNTRLRTLYRVGALAEPSRPVGRSSRPARAPCARAGLQERLCRVRARTVERRGFYVVIHFSGTVSTGRFQKIRHEPIDVRVIYSTNFKITEQ